MKKIILATKNENKLKEIKGIEQNIVSISSLLELKKEISWDETGGTFYENAFIKAKAAKNHTKLGVLGEDTGLIVEDINGEPGVYAKRYAGENATNEENMKKLLARLDEVKSKHRKAYFRTSLVYIDEQNKIHAYEGRCYGSILKEQTGEGGFGYDPIFMPDGYAKSFSEMGLETKNKISHRLKAFKAFLEDLTQK